MYVSIPPICYNESEWIVSVVLSQFLGLTFDIGKSTSRDIVIHRDNVSLTLNNDFFNLADVYWGMKPSLPEDSLKNWNNIDKDLPFSSINESLPVLYGKPGSIYAERERISSIM